MEEKAKLFPLMEGLIEFMAIDMGDDLDRFGYFEMWERIYSPEDFKKILRLVTLAQGRHLKLVK